MTSDKTYCLCQLIQCLQINFTYGRTHCQAYESVSPTRNIRVCTRSWAWCIDVFLKALKKQANGLRVLAHGIGGRGRQTILQFYFLFFSFSLWPWFWTIRLVTDYELSKNCTSNNIHHMHLNKQNAHWKEYVDPMLPHSTTHDLLHSLSFLRMPSAGNSLLVPSLTT